MISCEIILSELVGYEFSVYIWKAPSQAELLQLPMGVASWKPHGQHAISDFLRIFDDHLDCIKIVANAICLTTSKNSYHSLSITDNPICLFVKVVVAAMSYLFEWSHVEII